MKTVAQEMSPQERGERLKRGLEATGDEVVALNFSHLAQVIGMDEAESMIESFAQSEELVRNNYSMIAKMKIDGNMTVNRADALEAVNRALIDGKLDKEPAKFDAKAARAFKLAASRESKTGFGSGPLFGSGSLTRPSAAPFGTQIRDSNVVINTQPTQVRANDQGNPIAIPAVKEPTKT